MTITKHSSAPLVVVCGATGIQGGSVIKALQESDRPYRIRGFTRDASRSSATELTSQGVEIVQVSLALDNKPAILEAYKSAEIAFIMTNFWEHLDMQREIDEGCMLVDVSKEVGVKLLLWSGLDSVTKASEGKYTKVYHFDSKAAVTDYARKSGVPFINVQAGFYASNFTGIVKPRKLPSASPDDEDSYVVALPCSPTAEFPVIDAANDYGLYVREAIESSAFPPGSEILSCGEMISLPNIVSQLASVTKKNIRYVRLDPETFKAMVPFPDDKTKEEALQSFQSHEEFGYYGGKDVVPSQKHLARQPRSWMEFAKTTDWESVL